jgi:hypothetical protein
MSAIVVPPDPFDVDTLRFTDAATPALQIPSSTRPPRHRQGEPFLKGPIPWPWLKAALRLPGRSLHVALLLWKDVGVKNRRTVRFNLSRAAELLGVDTSTTRDGLRELERAGLLTVQVVPGRPSQVTVNDLPRAEPASPAVSAAAAAAS